MVSGGSDHGPIHIQGFLRVLCEDRYETLQSLLTNCMNILLAGRALLGQVPWIYSGPLKALPERDSDVKPVGGPSGHAEDNPDRNVDLSARK